MSGYISGNLTISVICGVVTFVVLVVLGMPYAAPLALLVAVLDLIPLVGATLGGALLVVVGLFVEPWKAVVLLVFVLVYQQVESNVGLDPVWWTPESLEAKPPRRESTCPRVPGFVTRRSSRLRLSS